MVPFHHQRFHQPTPICTNPTAAVDPYRSYIGRVGLDVMKWPAAARRRVRQHPSLANRFPQGRRGWLSLAHDMSGLGSARSVRQLWPFWEGLDGPDGGASGVRMAVFSNILNRWRPTERPGNGSHRSPRGPQNGDLVSLSSSERCEQNRMATLEVGPRS